MLTVLCAVIGVTGSDSNERWDGTFLESSFIISEGGIKLITFGIMLYYLDQRKVTKCKDLCRFSIISLEWNFEHNYCRGETIVTLFLSLFGVIF